MGPSRNRAVPHAQSRALARGRGTWPAAARTLARAGRQVDLAPRADPRALAIGETANRGPARRRRRAAHRRRLPRAGRRGDARRPRAAGASRGVGVGGLARAGGRARLRQRRHRRAADDGRRRRPSRSPRPSTATPRCASGRCGASSTRSCGWAREVVARPRAGALPLTLRGAARAGADRLRDAGRLGADQVGGAARRPQRPRRAPP